MKYIDRDIQLFKVNLEELENWRDNTPEGLPICGFISFYRAIGIEAKVKEIKELENRDIVPFDNILCNYFTLQAIKNFIKRQWKIYSIDIDQDNHVFWKNDQYGHDKHYEKNLPSKVDASLTIDFAHYCPGEDDELEDYELVIRLFDKTEEESEENEENQEVC